MEFSLTLVCCLIFSQMMCIGLIGQKMRGILESRGLQRMEAKGAEFDTDLHEAITQIPAPEPQMIGKVVDVVEPGYKLHDTVLRFAKVVVGH